MPTTRDHVLRGGLACAALLSLSTMTACSGDDPAPAGKGGRVATISGAPSTPAGAEQQGAMLRIDMTEADRKAVYDVYYACLEGHGVRMQEKFPGGPKVPTQEKKDNPEGYHACDAKEPYLDPLLDKTRNPKYADQFRNWLTCMNSKGVEVSGNWDDEFLKFGKRRAGIDGQEYLRIYRECDMASFKP
ncbi:hypothetical protein [Pseudosporangium ferrugineum]|uniref:Lipoprotein n=1 Tax=Pseudosporangium ferrugineum TaxID=439699 RepID=A0A2T0S1M4_9ACTN|nr:hypothetical protein [Pseudosporangium ferrugineum]PRY27317.1 hypothetical protein CLV70_111284 [Pseudosporangium ferrugineum]